MAYSNTSAQIQALSVVHTEFKDATIEALRAELAKTRLDAERARMMGEDLRSAVADPADPRDLYEALEEVN